ncbi:MAG: hypothetical protein ACXW1R_08470 [Halobacteriota archaeon]
MVACECAEQIRLLDDRFGVRLIATNWVSKKLFGGIAMDESTLLSLRRAADFYRDKTVTLYEMETIHKEFRPVEIPLTAEGLRILRGSMMCHFDLVWVPVSHEWALLTIVEMETYVCGPLDFVESVHDQF